MVASSRFSVAVHILTLLAQRAGEPSTSELVAGSVNTHPAVVRRLMMALARAGLTTSRFGAGGGALLGRPPREITLLDVYRAVDPGELVAPHPEPPSPDCRVGRHVQQVLERRVHRATDAFEASLADETIADVLADVARRERSRVRSGG
jgi:Rrf2 family protein